MCGSAPQGAPLAWRGSDTCARRCSWLSRRSPTTARIRWSRTTPYTGTAKDSLAGRRQGSTHFGLRAPTPLPPGQRPAPLSEVARLQRSDRTVRRSVWDAPGDADADALCMGRASTAPRCPSSSRWRLRRGGGDGEGLGEAAAHEEEEEDEAQEVAAQYPLLTLVRCLRLACFLLGSTVAPCFKTSVKRLLGNSWFFNAKVGLRSEGSILQCLILRFFCATCSTVDTRGPLSASVHGALPGFHTFSFVWVGSDTHVSPCPPCPAVTLRACFARGVQRRLQLHSRFSPVSSSTCSLAPAVTFCVCFAWSTRIWFTLEMTSGVFSVFGAMLGLTVDSYWRRLLGRISHIFFFCEGEPRTTPVIRCCMCGMDMLEKTAVLSLVDYAMHFRRLRHASSGDESRLCVRVAEFRYDYTGGVMSDRHPEEHFINGRRIPADRGFRCPLHL